MNRTEKIVAFLLGALVFAGLFVFILTSLRNPPAAPPLGDAPMGAEEEESFDFNAGVDTETVVSPEDIETPSPAATNAAPVKTDKK